MNILVTGGCGYVGSSLIPELLAKGYNVDVVDTQWFGNNLPNHQNLHILKEDIRDPKPSWFLGKDVVIHLAGVSNDPTAEFAPKLNYELNSSSTVLLAHMAREIKVPRFIFASSCSVYGFIGDRTVSRETDTPTPRFPYGISKLMAEKGLLSLMDTGFRVVILRKGTIGGGSPRMRLDLLVNTMVTSAKETGKILVRSKDLWRPVLDIRDCVRAYTLALEEEAFGIYNIIGGNYQLRDVGELVAKRLGRKGIAVDLDIRDILDLRNYKASGDLALERLGFQAYCSLQATVDSVLERLETESDLNDKKFYNIKVFEGEPWKK